MTKNGKTYRFTVKLRKKPLQGGRFSLILDYYNGNVEYLSEEQRGERIRQHLGLYLIPENTPEAKLTNEKTMKLAMEILEEKKKKIIVVALVDTLEYLKKGGRISGAVAFAGGLLNIKPVLAIADGEISMLGKARGSKMGNNLLVQEIEKAGGIDFTCPVLLGYTGISDALLLKYIDDSRHIWEGNLNEVRYTVIGSVIGTHAGPGAVAVAFFKN